MYLMEVRCIGMSEILLIDFFVLQYFIVVYQLLWPISSMTSIFWMQMVIKSMALTSFWGKRRLTFCFSVALMLVNVPTDVITPKRMLTESRLPTFMTRCCMTTRGDFVITRHISKIDMIPCFLEFILI